MQKGTQFESAVVAWLQEHVDRRIERRTKSGAMDRGDVAGVRSALGDDIAVECKNHRSMNLSGWVDEAELEAGNADAPVGVVIHKRSGKGGKSMGEQYVTMTLAAFTTLIVGSES